MSSPLPAKRNVRGDGNCFYHAVMLALGADHARELGCIVLPDRASGAADQRFLRDFIAALYGLAAYRPVIEREIADVERFAESAMTSPAEIATLRFGDQGAALVARDLAALSRIARADALWGSALEASVFREFMLKKHNVFLYHLKGGQTPDRPDVVAAVYRMTGADIQTDTELVFIVTSGQHYEYFTFGDLSPVPCRQYLRWYMTEEVLARMCEAR